MGEHVFGAKKCPRQVDGKRAVPIFAAHVGNKRGGAGDPCVVNQYIDPGELLLDLLDEPRRLRLVGEVGPEDRAELAFVLDGRRDL